MQGLDVLVGGRLVEPGVEQQLLDALVTGDALVRDPGRVRRLDLAVGGGEAAAAREAASPANEPMPLRAPAKPPRSASAATAPANAPMSSACESRSGSPIRTRMPSPGTPAAISSSTALAASSCDRYALHWTMGTPFVGDPHQSQWARGRYISLRAGCPRCPSAKSPSLSFSGESGNSSMPSLKRPLCSTSTSGPWRAAAREVGLTFLVRDLFGAFGKPVIRLIRLRRMRVFCVSFHAYGLPKAEPENSGRGRFTKPSDSAHSIVRANVSRTGV